MNLGELKWVIKLARVPARLPGTAGDTASRMSLLHSQPLLEIPVAKTAPDRKISVAYSCPIVFHVAKTSVR